MTNSIQGEESTWISELNLLDAMCAQYLDRFSLDPSEAEVDSQERILDDE